MDPLSHLGLNVVFGDWVYFSVVVVESLSVAGTPLISQPILTTKFLGFFLQIMQIYTPPILGHWMRHAREFGVC